MVVALVMVVFLGVVGAGWIATHRGEVGRDAPMQKGAATSGEALRMVERVGESVELPMKIVAPMQSAAVPVVVPSASGDVSSVGTVPVSKPSRVIGKSRKGRGAF
jgi:hypothetical protein